MATVTPTLGRKELMLTVGDPLAVVGGQAVQMDVPPSLVGGRTLVPLRFIANALGARLVYRAADRAIYIIYPAE